MMLSLHVLAGPYCFGDAPLPDELAVISNLTFSEQQQCFDSRYKQLNKKLICYWKFSNEQDQNQVG